MKDIGGVAKEDFDPHIGEEFELELGGGKTLALELVSCHARPSGSFEGATRVPFSLIFRSPGERRHAPQQIYTVRHAELGALEIFLVPIGRDEVGMQYQAAFS